MLLTIKTKALLTHCHTLLTDAEAKTQNGEGVAIVDEDSEQILRDGGAAIVEYCERNGCTKQYLSAFSLKHRSLFKKSKEYYGICINNYKKHIAEIGGKHIPILYAALMVQELKANRLVGLDIDYDQLIDKIKDSKHLQGAARPSKLVKDKFVVDLTKFREYNECVNNAILKVMKKR